MSKEIWILTIKTSLPNVAISSEDLKTTTLSFEHFEDAKGKLRERLKELAFSENTMFDGNGNLIMLDDFICEMFEDETLEADNSLLSPTKLKILEENLMHIFEGKDIPLSMSKIKSCNDGCFIALDIEEDKINLYGFEDGPINGINPKIKTNMFDMTKENNYYLYIDDMFGQDASSELYIDLIKSNMI